MNTVKTIVLSVVASICVIAVLTGGVICSQQVDSSLCSQVDVVVVDSLDRQYVDADELVRYLKSKKCYGLGSVMADIDCHAMETLLLEHPMVRTANCYKTPFGGLRIRVSQRVPVLCVKTSDAMYLVDADRKVMPCRSGMEQGLLVLSGAVNQRAALAEYYDFVLWLKQSDYWCSRIKRLNVHNTRHIVLTQNEYDANIVLGQLDGYEEKLERLQKLYTKGFDVLGYPDCRELDLRFTGQVVRR